MNTLATVAIRIIKEQERVIGPLAWSEAMKVRGLRIDRSQGQVDFADADQKQAIDRLVSQYARLFGRASEDVCRAAVAGIIAEFAPADVPTSLRA